MDPVKTIKGAADVAAGIARLGEDNPDLKAAGRELGKAALTIAKTVNLVLLPLAAVNFAFDKARTYFETTFESDMSERLQGIPEEDLIAPRASIAGPALQGLAFSHEEPSLKELYLRLLASAMNARTAPDAHPAFVEIISQLTSEEAPLLEAILRSAYTLPIVEVQLRHPDGGLGTLSRHLVHLLDDDGSEVDSPRLPAFLDNWVRLGLVHIEYQTKWLMDNQAYDWVERSAEFRRLKARHETYDSKVTFGKGILQRTDFGTHFAVATGIIASPSPTAEEDPAPHQQELPAN